MGGEGVFSPFLSVCSLLWEAEREAERVFLCWVFMSLCCKVLEACIVHGLMRVRPSLHGATGQFLAKVCGETGTLDLHLHTHTHTHRYTDVWRHKHADTGFFYSIKKVLFIYTHFLHSEPQDVKQPFETLCEVPIDPH